MKRKILCIVLAVALAVSCFTLVQAADGDAAEQEVYGGKITTAYAYPRTVYQAGTTTNNAKNTPFKGIDFEGKTSRTFKFLLYTAGSGDASISLSYNWATGYAESYSVTEDEKTYQLTNYGSSYYTFAKGKVATLNIKVPSDMHWANSVNMTTGTVTKDNLFTNGSGANKVDGSGIGFRLGGIEVGSDIYLICVGGDDATYDEISKINENLGSLEFVGGCGCQTTPITDWSENEATQLLYKARLGFVGVNYKVAAGTQQGYYKKLVPDLSNVKSEGEDTVTAKITVYNNSDKAALVSVYPQAAWSNIKGYATERVCLGAKTYYTYTVSYTTNDGKVTNSKSTNNEVSVYETDPNKGVFYRVDVLFQPDVNSGANNSNKQDIDITVMNANDTVYRSYDKGNTDVYAAPSGYADASTVNAKTEMVMYNGDFEDSSGSINKSRWTVMGGGSIGQEYRETADETLGNWSLKYTSGTSKYGSALFNVAPAVANFTAKDGVFNGGGAGFYKITFDAKADDNAVGTYLVKLESYDSGKNYISNTYRADFDTEWKTFTGIVEVTQERLENNYFAVVEKTTTRDKISAANAPIYIRFDGSKGIDGSKGGLQNAETTTGTYYIDNVKIEKVEFNADIEASITLNDSLAWNLYGEGIDKVDVTFNGKTTTVEFKDGKATFGEIGPKMMADDITFKFYQTIGGKEFTKEITTSVKEYMEEIIKGDGYTDTAKTLAIDTLNYGAATQVYDDYNAEDDNLANAGLTEAQKKAYYDVTKPESVYSQTGDGFKFKAASLYLKDKVYIRMYIAKDDYNEDMTVMVNGTELKNWSETDKYWYVQYGGISANELSNTVTAAVYKGETQVSTTLTYSVGTYAANKWESNSGELVKALVKYGNSAAAYTE